MDNIAFALTIGATFFWGLSLNVAKFCTGKMNVVTFNAVQYSVLAIALTPIVLLTGISVGSDWAVVMAVLSGAFWLFLSSQVFYYCLERAPAHVVIPLSNSSAIWGVAFSAMLLGEEIGPAILVSLAFIAVGIVLLAPRNGGGKVSTSVVLLSTLVAVIFGINQIIRKSALTAGISVPTFLWISALTGASLLVLTGLLRGSFRGQKLTAYNFGVSSSVGLLNQLVGGGLYLMALSLEKASSLAPVASSTIPFGFLLAIPLLRERPTWKAGLGIVTIFAGAVIVTL